MLFYLYTIITLIPCTFLLFGVSSDIKLNLTIGLVYSFLLFIAFIVRWRQYNFSILYYAVMYWSLLSFVMSSISNSEAESIFKFDSFLFNLSAAVALLAFIAFFYKRVEELSPFQLLLAGQTFLALCMYFGNWSLSYFILIYFISMIFIVFFTFVLHKQKHKVDYATITLVYVVTYLLFIYIEWHDIQVTWFQNYNILGFLTEAASIGSALCSALEFEAIFSTPAPLDPISSTVINQNYNAMWKQGSNMGFSSGSRRTTASPVAWSSASSLPTSKLQHSISEKLISSPKVAPAFIISSNISLSDLEEIDKQASSEIKEEHKVSNSGRDLSINTNIKVTQFPCQFSNGSALSSTRVVLQPLFDSIKRAHALNSRAYSTISAPDLLLGYDLKAEFGDIAYDYNIRSKLEELKSEDLRYTFFKQADIPVLRGIIGTHHMALIFISDGKHIFLVLLTTSESIPLCDSTFNEESKSDSRTLLIKCRNKKIPAIKTLPVSPKLLWAKPPGVYEGKYQYMASTIFTVSEEIVDDLIKAGLKKDPEGQAKLEELCPELKPTIIQGFEKSSFKGEDGLSYLRVTNLSKK